MVSNHTTDEVFRKLREDEDNRTCFDCGNIDITHASVNLGILLCGCCGNRHRVLGIEISNVRAVKDPWSTRHLKLMIAGGNSSLKTFFAMYSIPLNSANDYKYKTVACEYYREMLKMMAEGDRIMMVTPSEEEGAMLMEEFRPQVEEVKERPIQVKGKVESPKGIKEGIVTYERAVEKIRNSDTFTVIKGFTNDAFGFVSQGFKWGAEKGKEGIEWSAKQGKKLIRQMSNSESSKLMESANSIYGQLQKNLNLAKIKTDTLKMLKDLERNHEDEEDKTD